MGRADPERRYRKRYSEIGVRLGDEEIRFRIGIDRNGVRTGSDTQTTCVPNAPSGHILITFKIYPPMWPKCVRQTYSEFAQPL